MFGFYALQRLNSSHVIVESLHFAYFPEADVSLSGYGYYVVSALNIFHIPEPCYFST
jgi:hypothetical protein